MSSFFSFTRERAPTVRRGASAIFLSTFYDPNGNVVTPVGASVNISYSIAKVSQIANVSMVPPGTVGGDPSQWYAAWDTRGVDPGTIYWSIKTSAPVPLSVDEGNFSLVANPANAG